MSLYFDEINSIRQKVLEDSNLENAELFIFIFDEKKGYVLAGTEDDEKLLKLFDAEPNNKPKEEFNKLKEKVRVEIIRQTNVIEKDSKIEIILRYKHKDKLGRQINKYVLFKYFEIEDSRARGKRMFVGVVINDSPNIEDKLNNIRDELRNGIQRFFN